VCCRVLRVFALVPLRQALPGHVWLISVYPTGVHWLKACCVGVCMHLKRRLGRAWGLVGGRGARVLVARLWLLVKCWQPCGCGLTQASSNNNMAASCVGWYGNECCTAATTWFRYALVWQWVPQVCYAETEQAAPYAALYVQVALDRPHIIC
jgi:hypothetical protein